MQNRDEIRFVSVLREITGCPKLAFSLSLCTRDGVQNPGEMRVTVNSQANTARVRVSYPNGLEEELFVSWKGQESVWQRRVRNGSSQVIPLVEMGLVFQGVSFGKNHKDDYFYHAENPRIYDKLTIPVRAKRTSKDVKDSGFDVMAGNRWSDPGVVSDRVGASPYQPFPAVLLSNYRAKRGLVHGSLSQRVFYHNHLFRHENGTVVWEMFSSFKAVSHRNLAPGEIIDSDRWYLGVTDARDWETIFAGYTTILRQYLPAMWGQTAINRHSAVWGSWNDGIFRDIDQKRLLKMADFLCENFPTVDWLQVDDGYATRSGISNLCHGLGAPYEGKDAFDRKKFPDGLKYFTDEVRKRGIKPAIWVGGYVPNAVPLAKDHPDWFFDYSYRSTDWKPLDVSKPEVRQYMQYALDVLLTESGFEGVKQDFWSYAFEDSHSLLHNHNRSGYEWRSWWLREIRRRLPDYGYFQTGCDIVMGNPFLGEYFTNYRYGIDIASGIWENFLSNFLWGAACFATHTGDLFVPNSDSVGLFLSLPEAEALTWINYCIISRSLVEVSGWLYKYADHPRMRWMRKALACLNNGQDVHFARFDYRKQNEAPAVWYLTTPYFSRLEGSIGLPVRTVAVFNLDDKARRFALSAEDLKLPKGKYVATDAWSLTTGRFDELTGLRLPPHESRLFTISPKGSGPRILDANIEITAVGCVKHELIFDLRHRGLLELALSVAPVNVVYSGDMHNLKITRGKGNWQLRAKLTTPGTMALTFKPF